jgi:hypothetical protein
VNTPRPAAGYPAFGLVAHLMRHVACVPAVVRLDLDERVDGSSRRVEEQPQVDPSVVVVVGLRETSLAAEAEERRLRVEVELLANETYEEPLHGLVYLHCEEEHRGTEVLAMRAVEMREAGLHPRDELHQLSYRAARPGRAKSATSGYAVYSPAPAMTSTSQPADLNALLETFDEADTAVRALYRQLADNPDLATEYEAGLRELQRKRLELAQQVGVAALAEWRAARSGVATSLAGTAGTLTTPVVKPVTERDTNGVASTAPIPPAPLAPPTESVPTVELVQPSEPAPAEPPASTSPVSPPASDAQLTEWKRAVQLKGLGATPTPAPPPQRPWGVSLHEMMCLLGPPEVDLNDSVALLEELDALDEVATPERQKLWVRLPIEVQKRWLSHLVARTRAIREHPSSDGVLEHLKKIRAVYPEWARQYVPGHINGLQLKHAPIHGTWAKDAEDHWRALGVALGPDFAARVTRSTPKKRKERERTSVGDEPVVVESDWPLLPVVQGKTVLIVGGAPKEPNRERLESYLKLASLEWPLVDGPRKVEAVAQRVAKGTYDIVLVILTLVAHNESERILDAAKEAKVPWAMVEGYGTASVRSGIERFLRPAMAR